MHAAEGAISRARMRARAHLEIAADGHEVGEIQGLQFYVLLHLTHVWPRASSAAGAARRDQPSAGEGGRGRARTVRLPIVLQS